MRCVYYKGCHLWEHWEDWDPQAQREGSSRHQGVAQAWGHTNPASPNFQREITVRAYISPMGQVADLPPDDALDVLLLQIEDELVSLSKTKGALCYTYDNTQKAAVTGGPYASAGLVNIGSLQGDWSPTAGRLVLVRKPTTGAGFACSITTVGSGSLTLAALANETWQEIDSDWEIVYVQQVLTLCSYERMSRGVRSDALAENAHRRDVEYVFSNHTSANHSPAHAIPRGNS